MTKQQAENQNNFDVGLEAIVSLLSGEIQKEERPPHIFLTKLIEDLQGGPDQSLRKSYKYGFKDPISAPGFDDPDEGMRKVEDILYFINEVMTREPAHSDEQMSEFSRCGIGHICSICGNIIAAYNRDIFNSLERLQELIQEKEGSHE